MRRNKRIESLLDRIGEELEASREYNREAAVMLRRLSDRMEEGTNVLHEARGEIRAQTQAIWRVIDRMDRMNPGGASGSAPAEG